MSDFCSKAYKKNRFLPGIHGLRGIAAQTVVLFHLTHLAHLEIPSKFSFIASDFGKGVHLFFILSAYSLMHSTADQLQHSSWIKIYFLKRFFRIAPLFYVLITCLLARSIWQNTPISWETVFLNLSFTFGLAPWTGIVWAGWSIGVESLFYAIFPLLLLTINSRRDAFVLAITSLLISLAFYSTLSSHFAYTTTIYQYNWAYFSFQTNFFYFSLGICAFRVTRDSRHYAELSRNLIFALPAIVIALIALSKSLHLLQNDTILWGIAFAALVAWQGKWPSKWSANALCERLGERSYSIYLIHPILITLLKPQLQMAYYFFSKLIGPYAYFVVALFLMIPLLILVEVSYRYIELPGIRLGRRLGTRVVF